MPVLIRMGLDSVPDLVDRVESQVPGQRRHLTLPGLGEGAQQRLLAARELLEAPGPIVSFTVVRRHAEYVTLTP